MKHFPSQQHKVDMIFPLALAFVFVMSALSVLLLAADVYGKITGRSAQTNSSAIAASYLTEKVRQNDEANGVRLDTLGDSQALVLDHPQQAGAYCTYIYYYDGQLRELMASRELQPDPSQGRSILPLRGFEAEQQSENLFRFTCTDRDGRSTSVYVSVQSGKE